MTAEMSSLFFCAVCMYRKIAPLYSLNFIFE